MELEREALDCFALRKTVSNLVHTLNHSSQGREPAVFTAYFAQRISPAVRRKVSEQIQTVCTRWTRKRPPRATRAPLQPVPGG
jgi:hypothetical protein